MKMRVLKGHTLSQGDKDVGGKSGLQGRRLSQGVGDDGRFIVGGGLMPQSEPGMGLINLIYRELLRITNK